MQPLDAIDRQIIAALRIDARKPVSRLASELGIARATAEKRLARMIDSGTILGFTVRARDDTPAKASAVMPIAVVGRSTAALTHSPKSPPAVAGRHPDTRAGARGTP